MYYTTYMKTLLKYLALISILSLNLNAQSWIPTLNDYVKNTLPEYVNNTANVWTPQSLKLIEDVNINVYFASEGAGYHNTIGVNNNTIFQDANIPPLQPGDMINIGNYKSGNNLEFFLIANGDQGGNLKYTLDKSNNPDHINHMNVFQLEENSPYIFVSWEDMMGGDNDFNDVIIALNVGQKNANYIMSIPEPHVDFIMYGLIIFILFIKRDKLMKSVS